MTSNNQANSILLDQQVDRICDHFEAAWLAGQPISIEACCEANIAAAVAKAPSQSPEVERAFRQRLISELIALDISFRRERGEELAVEDYLRRFPSVERAAVEAWIENSGSSSGATLTETLEPLQDVECRQIGSYHIIEKLGQGGMGEVYRAQQRLPIRREVAIKLIKLGMDTKILIARFEAERQALALMDHPHIA